MTHEPIESLWDHLLSREADLILAAYTPLDEETRQAVLAHLTRMATEEGWHPEQRMSALAALDAINPPGEQTARL